MSIYERLAGHLRDGMTPEEATEKVLADPAALDLLYPLVLREAVHADRAITRVLERKVETEWRGTKEWNRVESRRALAARMFKLPDGSEVEWAAATAEQHLLRAQWQRTLSDACVRDAELHEQAAAEITKAGVSCLRDLEPKRRSKRSAA